MNSANKIRKQTGTIFVAVFTLHVLLSITLVFYYPRKNLYGRSLPARFYEHFVHLGPFFDETRLQYYTHFIVSFKYEGQWTTVDLTKEQMDVYYSNILRVDKLTERDYLNHYGHYFANDQNKDTYPFRSLDHYLSARYYQGRTPDSVRWEYRRFYTAPVDGNSAKHQLVFTFQYKPDGN